MRNYPRPGHWEASDLSVAEGGHTTPPNPVKEPGFISRYPIGGFVLGQPFLAAPQTVRPTFPALKSEEGGSSASGMTYQFRGTMRWEIVMSPNGPLSFVMWRRAQRNSPLCLRPLVPNEGHARVLFGLFTILRGDSFKGGQQSRPPSMAPPEDLG